MIGRLVEDVQDLSLKDFVGFHSLPEVSSYTLCVEDPRRWKRARPPLIHGIDELRVPLALNVRGEIYAMLGEECPGHWKLIVEIC